MPRRPPPGAPSLLRSSGQSSSQSAIFIFCEGQTERVFLDSFRARLRLSKRLVQTFCVGDPKACVRKAAEKFRAEKKNGAEVWVVFDRDEHYHWRAAIDRARALGLGLAISNPCFELWAMLLHSDHRANLTHHEAQRQLKLLHPDYDHAKNPYLNMDLVSPLIRTARFRCVGLLQVAAANGDELGNPTSRFYELLDAIQKKVGPVVAEQSDSADSVEEDYD